MEFYYISYNSLIDVLSIKILDTKILQIKNSNINRIVNLLPFLWLKESILIFRDFMSVAGQIKYFSIKWKEG